MSSAVMTKRITATPPRFKAKMAGVLSLLSVLAAALAETFARGGLNVAAGLIAVLGMIGVTLLFYDTLSPVNRNLSLLAVSFNLVGLIIEALRLQPRGVNIAYVFDGFYCILIGCLLFRSTFRPRILGALMVFGGLGWLTFLSSPLANYLSSYNLACGLLGEGSVCLWLILSDTAMERTG
ncbi:MAG: DUF4386 domain-containing protein [Terriglobales bacterium]